MTLTTSTAHGFSVGDLVNVSLPSTATLSGNRVFDANTNLVTYTTSGAHGFGVGDLISISLTPTSVNSTSKSATATTCTLTVGTNHGIAPGDIIQVSGEGSRWDGTYVVSAVTSTTVAYERSGSVSGAVSASGTVTNISVRDHYNGAGVVESTPSTTTFTVSAWGLTQNATAVASGTVTNTTNQLYSKTGASITATPSTTQFTYNI